MHDVYSKPMILETCVDTVVCFESVEVEEYSILRNRVTGPPD